MSRLRRVSKHRSTFGHIPGHPKPVFKLKHKHAKPLRKRHILVLSLFALLGTTSCLEGIKVLSGIYDRQMGAVVSVQDQVSSAVLSNKLAAIRSAYGFTISIDPKIMSTTASIGTGAQTKFYDITASTQPRDYSKISFAPLVRGASTAQSSYDRSTMSLNVDEAALAANDSEGMRNRSLANIATTGVSFRLISETDLNIGEQPFKKYTYQASSQARSQGRLSLSSTTWYVYATRLQSGKPVFITVKDITEGISPVSLYDAVISTFSPSANVPDKSAKTVTYGTPKIAQSSLLKVAQQLGIVGQDAEAQYDSVSSNPWVIAANAPAVVKVYHIVCGGVEYYGQSLLPDQCKGSAGSGFFINNDGYLATNGHVVTTSAKDFVAQNLTPEMLARILSIEGYSSADIQAMVGRFNTDTSMQSMLLSAIYKLDNSSIKFTNQKDYYYVALGNDMPDMSGFMESRTLPESKTIRAAEFVGADYNPGDLIRDGKFSGSDVAMLRVKGSDFPVARLGTIGSVAQGSLVTVLGFPGVSDSNPITSSRSLQTTASNGIVSAIRESNGGGKKIIQSDVKLGVGNSGGPVLSSRGEVIGIATYLYSGTEKGDAQYSYLRDIQDLKDLAKEKGVTLGAVSNTQQTWEDGLQDFFAAKYSAALQKFRTVQQAYPAHALAPQYISMAQAKIQNGEEVKNGAMPEFLGIVLVGAVIGLAVTAALIVRHRLHHKVYKAALLGHISVPFISLPASKFNLFTHHATANIPVQQAPTPRQPLDIDE